MNHNDSEDQAMNSMALSNRKDEDIREAFDDSAKDLSLSYKKDSEGFNLIDLKEADAELQSPLKEESKLDESPKVNAASKGISKLEKNSEMDFLRKFSLSREGTCSFANTVKSKRLWKVKQPTGFGSMRSCLIRRSPRKSGSSF